MICLCGFDHSAEKNKDRSDLKRLESNKSLLKTIKLGSSIINFTFLLYISEDKVLDLSPNKILQITDLNSSYSQIGVLAH